MLAVPKMIVHLTLQSRFHHHLGQPTQQPALPCQLQPLRPGPIDQLPQQLII
jgi:hypothetical protein